MKGIDPQLIKWGFFGLVFIIRAFAATNRKQKAKNRAISPPQSAPPPPPIAASNQIKSDPMPQQKQKPSADSPWTNSKGPFDS